MYMSEPDSSDEVVSPQFSDVLSSFAPLISPNSMVDQSIIVEMTKTVQRMSLWLFRRIWPSQIIAEVAWWYSVQLCLSRPRPSEGTDDFLIYRLSCRLDTFST